MFEFNFRSWVTKKSNEYCEEWCRLLRENIEISIVSGAFICLHKTDPESFQLIVN